MGLQEVKLQGAQRVASLEVVPSQKPIWYWPVFFSPRHKVPDIKSAMLRKE
jgi:hypothetical protein